ncbi:MAG: hypothetical protein Q9190_004558 [Brigantiaea leucoxantha]
MLRSFSRAASRSSPLRILPPRTHLPSSKVPAATCLAQCRLDQRRYESAVPHAISNPTLADIERRWEDMPPNEQALLWMALRDRMKGDWHDLTWQEKRAAWWVAFGPHGPRAEDPPGENWFVFKRVMMVIGVSTAVFIVIRQFARPPPKTMTKEWQEATNEYLKRQNTEPITGISSEGYKGKGMVQSKPRKGPPPDEDEE